MRRVDLLVLSLVCGIVLWSSGVFAQEHGHGHEAKSGSGSESGQSHGTSQEHGHEKSAEQAHTAGLVAEDATLVGEVIDPVCFVSHPEMGRGKEHKECAEYCVKQGLTLGVLDDKTDQIYISFPIDHANPNEKLKDYIAEKVKVTGDIYKGHGIQGIYVKKVEKVK
jgi:hypothetical protein